MVEWLERGDNLEPTNLDVWGIDKPQYNFKDLGIWKKDGTLELKKKDIKGKAKEKVKERVNTRDIKKRAREDDDDKDKEMGKKSKKSSKSKAHK